MATPKFKEYYDLMISQNQVEFDEFQIIHDKYAIDPTKYQKEFNDKGRDIQDIIRNYENRLCGKSEGSGYSKYSTNLSEKFHEEVKKHFPKIDYIGLF